MLPSLLHADITDDMSRRAFGFIQCAEIAANRFNLGSLIAEALSGTGIAKFAA